VEARPKKWRKRAPIKPEALTDLRAALGDRAPSSLVLQLLWNRDLKTPEAVTAFLAAAETPLPDPLTLVGMADAVAAIGAALDAGQRIAVWGDFDADGVTATTLLTHALRAFGGQVEPYVPHRVKEGYGLNKDALTELAKSGVKLVITVDCGVSNREEAAHAQQLGLDLVITDHHSTSGDIPNAKAVLNPKLGSDPAFEHLAGVGVAYQVVRALVTARGKPPTLRNNDLLELVALGTVADMAKLVGANRTLVALGLGCLNKTRRPGLLELLKVARHEGPITAQTIGFTFGPRLNAVGRLDDARWAYELLLTADRARAAELAQKLEADNRKRTEIMKQSVEQARAMALQRDPEEKLILVSHPAWEPGVVGLVAGRLCEEFHRPAIAIAQREEFSRGSARSTRHFDIYEALTVCRDEGAFEGGRMGGHPAAAGFTIRTENIEALHEQLLLLADNTLSDDQLTPDLQAEAELALDDITLATLEDVSRLEPFGVDNPVPIFVVRSVRVLESAPFKEGSPHLRLKLGAPDAAPGEPGLEATLFHRGAEWAGPLAARPLVDVMFTLEGRTWKEEKSVRLVVKDLRPSKGAT
jgi:single-stranded-DNA-specific exonuclease